MTTATSGQTIIPQPETDIPDSMGVPQRTEEFPGDSFRYLESKLRLIRRLIMNLAARTAADCTNKEEPVYRVEREHVDDAIAKVVHPDVADIVAAHELSSYAAIEEMVRHKPK
jgi:hypothetical protein